MDNRMVCPKWLIRFITRFLTIFLPLFLLLISMRIWFTPAVLKWEYRKSDMPPDRYGFSTEERIEYGQKVLDYILDNNKSISYLNKLTFADGRPLFNSREIRHEKDVKKVVNIVSYVGYPLILLYSLCVIFVYFAIK